MRALFPLLAVAAALVLALLPVPPASGGQSLTFGFSGTQGESGLPSSWSFKRWSPVVSVGTDFEAIARVQDDTGRRVLYVKSRNAGLTVGTRRSADVSVLRYASWSWKAEELPAGGSFRARSTNDQALQLLFGFEGGKVVGYIWDSTGSPGASGSGLSWQEDVRVIVLEAGAAKVGRWVDERVDLLADFRRLFGEDPPALGGVGLQCNSQHTVSSGSGFLGPVTLSAE